MVKIFCGIAIGGIVLSLTSCSRYTELNGADYLDENYYSFISNAEIEESKFTKKIEEYNSEVTACFEDENGLKHLFVYASPIRFQQNGMLVPIDDRIVPTSDQKNDTYLYKTKASDITTYYPKSLGINQGIRLKSTDAKIDFGPSISPSADAKLCEMENFVNITKQAVIYSDINDGWSTFAVTQPHWAPIMKLLCAI